MYIHMFLYIYIYIYIPCTPNASFRSIDRFRAKREGTTSNNLSTFSRKARPQYGLDCLIRITFVKR